jgi:glucosamine--fructose-6-phosphate aminotransferase (isomerizing)
MNEMNNTEVKNQASLMKQEAHEASERIKEQLLGNANKAKATAQKIREFNPQMVMFVGRGSSDHAGTYGKYLIEVEMGIPTFGAVPSVATIYNRYLKLENTLVIVISQSGRSPDILEQTKQAKKAGAMCIALVNDEESPLVDMVDCMLPLSVGQEKSVAATKSYLATLSAILQLVAYWSGKKDLIDALEQIPLALSNAAKAQPQLKKEDIKGVKNLVVLGRGFGYAVGNELALKLKEVCAIHAESFSSAEFLHGPVTLVNNQFKVLDIQVIDEAFDAHNVQIENIKVRGASVVKLHQVTKNLHPRIAPLAVLQRFYLDVEQIAIQRGLNPDVPRGLKKVTETI